jgi:hypothetical protein
MTSVTCWGRQNLDDTTAWQQAAACSTRQDHNCKMASSCLRRRVELTHELLCMTLIAGMDSSMLHSSMACSCSRCTLWRRIPAHSCRRDAEFVLETQRRCSVLR